MKTEKELKNISNNISELKTDLLIESIKISSVNNRNVLIFFMLLLLTIFSISTNTTDYDLVVNSSITFPIIGLEMPTFYFYILAPLLFIIVHFTTLFNLAEHIQNIVFLSTM